MADRLDLHSVFLNITRNVYYQPPTSMKLSYPAIVYKRSKIENTHANNSVYKQENAYQVTVIDEDPDSEIVKQVSLLPYCSFMNHFTSDNLNHDVFTIYY